LPTSVYTHVVDVLDLVWEVQPNSILDVGCGWGKWGVLFRDVVDVVKGNYLPKDYKVKIDAVEVFDKYENSLYSVYSKVVFGEIGQLLKDKKIGQYDMIYMGDVIEHFSRESAKLIVQDLLPLVTKLLVLAVPLGVWEQDVIGGNRYERHLSSWELGELAALVPGGIVREYSIFDNLKKYGLVYLKKGVV